MQQDLQTYICGVGAGITNFSLDVDEYTTASSTICVDLVDYYDQIDTVSGTYFIIDGVVVSGTFTIVTVSGTTVSGSAYRMCYDAPDDFGSLLGPVSFVVRAENQNGNVSENEYFLTYGYGVFFDNEENNYIDFGYDTQVVVRALLEDLASCPKESGTAYWFETMHDPYAVSEVVYGGNSGLSASITPYIPPDAYYPGKTMYLIVRAKDLSGNEMEPFVLEYTIKES